MASIESALYGVRVSKRPDLDLRRFDRKTPKHLGLHLFADSYGTHKHPAVQAWLAKHPRFAMHFSPTSASRLNMAERS